MNTVRMKSIKIGFENVETVDIAAEDVASFYLGDIVSTVVNSWYSENISTFENAGKTRLILKGTAEKEFSGYNSEMSVFERIIKYNDITNIEIIFEDDTTRDISVSWNEEDEYENRYQSSALTADGYLFVVIEKDVNALDIIRDFGKQYNEIKTERMRKHEHLQTGLDQD